jgi:plasmid stabilization system protein ParE
MIIEWSIEARASFLNCAQYIKFHSSERIAEKWMNEVEKSLKTLEVFPLAGRKTSKYRKWQAHKNYYALYETYDGFVYIVHFRHSKRKPLEYKAKKRQNPDSQD